MTFKALQIDESWLLYLRHGHLKSHSLKVFVKTIWSKACRLLKKNRMFYEGCALKKHHKQEVVKEVAQKANHLLQLVLLM